MDFGVTKLISARTLEALPDGTYHTNNISTLDAKSLRHAFRYGDLGREMQRMGAR